MPLCKFSPNTHMFDVTPVENLFIQEFMLKAPGDFVKVYLYGLMQCYCCAEVENTLERFSINLGLESDIVENAFRYWERQGIVKLEINAAGVFSVCFNNVKDLLYNNKLSSHDALAQYKDFNQTLQVLFDTRLLTPQEYLKIYDWIELLGLPQEVVIMLISFYISKKDVRISINYLDKIAQRWVKDGINTLKKAEEHIEQSESVFKNAHTILKYLGIYRMPSKAELDLCRKWLNEWGFPLETILHASKQTTHIQNPNMNYLDKILESYYQKGAVELHQFNEMNAHRQSKKAKIKDVLYHLGLRNTAITPEHEALYEKWRTQWRFHHDAILIGCRECTLKSPSSSIRALDETLSLWQKLQYISVLDIEAYLKSEQTLDAEIKAVLERADAPSEFSPALRRLYQKWLSEWKLPFELILLAAEYSRNANKKVPFMSKILSSWHQDGILTLSAAQRAHKEITDKHASTGKPANKIVFDYDNQREYRKDDFDHLIQNLEAHEG